MGIGDLLRREFAGLLDLLLPSVCPFCGGEPDTGREFDVCSACLIGIHPLGSPCCPRCAVPYEAEGGSNHLCENCLRHPPPFEWIQPLGLYEATLRKAVHAFKYRTAVDLDRPLASLLADSVTCHVLCFSPHLLIPVPLHRLRLRQRTYNQSLLLARRLGRIWSLPVESGNLVRTRPTVPQQGLSAHARRRNMRGAFALRKGLVGKRVLLVDDVVTTGATVRECSRLLRAGGASAVGVVTLARARRHF